MHFLLGFPENLKTVYLLSRPHMEPDQPGLKQVREGYREFLQAVQPEVPSGEGAIVRVATGVIRDELVQIFAEDLESPPPGAVEAIDADGGEHGWREKLFESSFETLREIDPQLKTMLDLTVDHVFWSPAGSVGSASTGDALGALLVNPSLTWNVVDVMEALVHELTHTLLMLDERRFGHYVDAKAIEDPINFVPSAIRNQDRPFNAVAHSIIVSYEVLAFRGRHLMERRGDVLHGDTDQLRGRAAKAAQSAMAHPRIDELITPRLKSLLEMASSRLEAMEAQEMVVG